MCSMDPEPGANNDCDLLVAWSRGLPENFYVVENQFLPFGNSFYLLRLRWSLQPRNMGNILNAGLVGLCLVLVYIFHNRSKQSALARQHGCSLPPKFPQKDPLFGLFLHTRLIPISQLLYSITSAIAKHSRSTLWAGALFGPSHPTTSELSIQQPRTGA